MCRVIGVFLVLWTGLFVHPSMAFVSKDVGQGPSPLVAEWDGGSLRFSDIRGRVQALKQDIAATDASLTGEAEATAVWLIAIAAVDRRLLAGYAASRGIKLDLVAARKSVLANASADVVALYSDRQSEDVPLIVSEAEADAGDRLLKLLAFGRDAKEYVDFMAKIRALAKVRLYLAPPPGETIPSGAMVVEGP